MRYRISYGGIMIYYILFLKNSHYLRLLSNSFCQLFESLSDYHAGTLHIQAHESLTTRTKHFTIIQCQMSLVDKKVKQLFMVEMQIPTVEPSQEGSLRTQRTDARNMLPAEILYETDVFFNISKHLLAILLSMTECCNRGYWRKTEKSYHISLVF